METIINQIMDISCAMPKPEKHRLYLATLDTPALEKRLETLQAQAGAVREPVPVVQFWKHAVRVEQRLEAIHA